MSSQLLPAPITANGGIGGWSQYAYYLATEGQTTFTATGIDATPGRQGVTRNGINMSPGEDNDYTVVGDSVVFNYGLDAGTSVQLYW